jgi:ABC-type transport system substrate-binding protein
MLAQGGIKLDVRVTEYTQFLPHYTNAYQGGRTGDGINGVINYVTSGGGTPSPALFAYGTSHPAGRVFTGATPDGTTNASKGDPEITSLIEKWLVEFDPKRSQQLAHEYQRLSAVKAYSPPEAVDSPGFSLTWPVVGNLGVYTAYSSGNPLAEGDLHNWIDDSMPPLRRA